MDEFRKMDNYGVHDIESMRELTVNELGAIVKHPRRGDLLK